MTGRAGRDYLPLAISGVVLLLLLAALPSTLDISQSDPSETLEYAPVPPGGEQLPPSPENLASLGLATGRGVGSDSGEDGSGGGATGEGGPTGIGKNPSTKRCIGRPPRQTEDRLSPPCVAHFSGDNFGATYQGVTRDEIRVLFYLDGGVGWRTQRQPHGEITPVDTYVDLWERPADGEHLLIKTLRAYQRHFNERYQTYERRAHFFVYFSGHGTRSTPETRRSDAVANSQRIKPFAVITFTPQNGTDPHYVEEMAQAGVLNFGTFSGRAAAFYRTFPKMIWGYEPTVEQQAEHLVDFVCKKVVPHAVSFSGNPGEHGRPRRLGLLTTRDPDWPWLEKMGELVRSGVEACGGEWAAQASYRSAGHFSDANEEEAPANMAMFRERGVTTVIWPGGMEVGHTNAAAASAYFPEWVLAGDRVMDAGNAMQYQNQAAFREHAWIVTPVVDLPPTPQRACYQAYREADTTESETDVEVYGCRPYFDPLRQLFTGIQVAGPRLDPQTIDRGFHAIPRLASTDPSVPACFYEPADYTCVKDAVAMWWTTGTDGQGCWRMAAQGRRFLRNGWPEGDVLGMRTPQDACSLYRAIQ